MRPPRPVLTPEVRPTRRGFSLIEVIIATAILLGSAVLLSRLAGLGRTYAQNTTQMAQAQRICENTLNEIMMGIRPLSPVESGPIMPLATSERQDDDRGDILRPGEPQDRLVTANNSPRWLHSVRLRREEGTPGLMSLTVEVMPVRRSDRQRSHFALTRWIRQTAARTPFDGSSDGVEPMLGGVTR